MDPYPTDQAAYAFQQPHRSHRPALPDWAKAFRTVLIILGGVMAILWLSFLGVNAATESNFYTESGRAAIHMAFGLGALILLLSVPYLLASLAYAVVWALSLRGRGYRSYPESTWFLIAAPLATGIPLAVWIGLWF